MDTSDRDLLMLLWAKSNELTNRFFSLASGGTVHVVSKGQYSHEGGCFSWVEAMIDGKTVKGDVVFGTVSPFALPRYAILQVVSSPCDSLVGHDGERIPQMILPIAERTRFSVESLRRGARDYECGLWLADISRLERIGLFEKLYVERLQRKCGEIVQIFEDSDRDWSQAFHVMLFRGMGGNRNRMPYMKLASRAPYSMVLRERSSVTVVEALLLGTAGLLDKLDCYNDYVHELREHYKYLCSKWNLTPMYANEWEEGRTYPLNFPKIRIVQLASFLSGNDFVFDRMISCRTREDIHRLFSAEASHYWTTHYVPDNPGTEFPKRIGEEKADLLGINVVVPMMFAYGSHVGKEELKEAAVELLSLIPAERNSIINSWTGKGVPVSNASDSQSLLQLYNEYCIQGRCTTCRVGRKLISI